MTAITDQPTEISAALSEAIAKAETFCERYPLAGQTLEARIALHVIIEYVRDLGASQADQERIIGILSDASSSSWTRGWMDRAKR